jgi:hypothetical protein
MKKLAAIGVAFALTWSLSGCVVSGDGSSSMEENTNETSSEEQSTESSDAATVGGTLLDASDIAITLLSVKSTKKGSFGSGPDNDYFLVAKFELDNQSNEEVAISSLMSFALDGESGRGYDMTLFVDLDGNLDGSIKPGRKMLGEIAFDASKEDLYYLSVQTGLFDDGVEFQFGPSDIQ